MISTEGKTEFDLLIAGAGPAGCTLALRLAGKGIRTAIFEKDTFPRDKICGDALSGKALSVMKRMPAGLFEKFRAEVPAVPSSGIRFSSPSGKWVDVPFPHDTQAVAGAPGYVCRRRDFDDFLFRQCLAQEHVTIFEGEAVTGVERQSGRIIFSTAERSVSGRMAAAADGVHSVAGRLVPKPEVSKKHYCLAIRGYYRRVAGMHPGNFIELIFLGKTLPGYFWIFPGPDGLINVGLGVPQEMILKKRINLIRIFREMIDTHPLIAPRFREAIPEGKPGAHLLPLGSANIRRSGDRAILLGDAAFMVDPFSGEGIGNAMASAEIAAEVIKGCFDRNDLSAEALGAYDQRLNRRFGREFRTTAMMQRLARHAFLINLVVRKASDNRELQGLLSAMFSNEDLKEKLTSPGFWAGLLLK